jgi:hypothetical protein
MKRGFKFTELADGESIVFGPITSSSTTSFSGGTGAQQGSVSKSSGRTVGVTNQRVVVEDLDSPDKTQTYSNDTVRRVYVKRTQRGNVATLTLSRIETASGQVVKLKIMGIPAQAESRLKETFPNAEIAQDKKCFVATAAYGSALAPQVVTLRRFRDTRLRQKILGRWAINAYEWCSPPLADWVAPRATARAWIRGLLLRPTVWAVERLMRRNRDRVHP